MSEANFDWQKTLARSRQPMRLFIAAMICVATVVAASACANAQEATTADPVERLFQDQPTAHRALDGLPSIAGNEPVSAILSEELVNTASQSTGKDGVSQPVKGPTLWDAVGGDEGVSSHVSNIAAAERSTSEPAATAVPEPSAILLALAALVYFLLFGRRRRMG